MKNRTKKLFAVGMILAMMLVFASCGGPENLEQYINEDENAKAALEAGNDSNAAGDMIVEVKENTVIYTFKMNQTFEGDVKTEMEKYFVKYMKTAGATFEGLAADLEEESGIDGVTVHVAYLNGDGSELFSEDYVSAAEE